MRFYQEIKTTHLLWTEYSVVRSFGATILALYYLKVNKQFAACRAKLCYDKAEKERQTDNKSVCHNEVLLCNMK